MGKTTIKQCGSRWAGQENGTVEDLLKLIEIEPLDSSWSSYCSLNLDGSVNIGGNFERISHGFSIDTKDTDLIAKFAKAFEANGRIDKDELYKTEVAHETKVLMGLRVEAIAAGASC